MAEELEHAGKAVRDLRRALKSLPEEPRPEAVHRLRTTTRRVEAIVSVFSELQGKESRRVLKSIEPIRKAAGGVREMDVMIADARKLTRYVAGDSLNRLVEQLRIARRQNAAELRRVLSRRRSAARQKLGDYLSLIRKASARAQRMQSPSGPPSDAHDGIHAAAAQVVRELGNWPQLNAENIHPFRLKVKELRYILQLSSDANSKLGEALGDVQRRIGDWHDWHQLHEIASQVLTPERDLALLERVDRTAKRKFDQALATANRLRGKYLSMPVARGA